jgi:large subunit ribosomal protein L6
MSRIAKNPIPIPKGVDAAINDGKIVIKGVKGTLSLGINPKIAISIIEGFISIDYDRENRVQNVVAGTTRANIANMIVGVNIGFERKLVMTGVGYRAQTKGDNLILNLGFSHQIELVAPSGILLEVPSQTEIVVRGCDRQRVGQVAANIRAYRPPEPYKGKGIRYSNEQIVKKEAKKK